MLACVKEAGVASLSVLLDRAQQGRHQEQRREQRDADAQAASQADAVHRDDGDRAQPESSLCIPRSRHHQNPNLAIFSAASLIARTARKPRFMFIDWRASGFASAS